MIGKFERFRKFFKSPEKKQESSFEEKQERKIETSSSPEKKYEFTEAVEKIKRNERAVKLLALKELGFLPTEKQLSSINVDQLVGRLRNEYPTIEDIQKDLEELVDEEIGVEYESYWAPERYLQELQQKKLQYKQEAVQGIVEALRPVYEKYGSPISEKCKERIFKNLQLVIGRLEPRNLSPFQRERIREYIKKNLWAAVKQKLSKEEVFLFYNWRELFFKKWEEFPNLHCDAEIEKAFLKIKSRSEGNPAIALASLKGPLEILPGKYLIPERYKKNLEKKMKKEDIEKLLVKEKDIRRIAGV